MFNTLRTAVRAVDASVPMYDMRTLDDQMEISLLTERLLATLSSVFGCLATLLAALGLYGVMAFMVARRTREIGIRMALGAGQGSVVWMVLRETLTLAGIGVAIGLAGAYAVTRLIQTQLFGVAAHRPAHHGRRLAGNRGGDRAGGLRPGAARYRNRSDERAAVGVALDNVSARVILWQSLSQIHPEQSRVAGSWAPLAPLPCPPCAGKRRPAAYAIASTRAACLTTLPASRPTPTPAATPASPPSTPPRRFAITRHGRAAHSNSSRAPCPSGRRCIYAPPAA